jgi:hypothetical protein
VQSKLLLGENELFWLERFHRNGSFRMLNWNSCSVTTNEFYFKFFMTSYFSHEISLFLPPFSSMKIHSVDDFVCSVNSHLTTRQENERLKGIMSRIESYDVVVSFTFKRSQTFHSQTSVEVFEEISILKAETCW